MAKKHVALRYIQCEQEYLEMSNLLKELNEELQAGKIDINYYNEKVELLSDEIEKTKLQYFFWAEAMFELNKPNKKGKEMDSTMKSWYDTLQTQTKELLKDDGANASVILKDILKEGKIK